MPIVAIRDRLLPAMQASPEGKTLAQYAAEIYRGRTSVEREATALFAAGLVIRARAGVAMLWTAAEHAETLPLGVAREKDRQIARLESSGVLAERERQEKARRRAHQQKYRKAKREKLAEQKQDEQAPRIDGGESRSRGVPSVWEFAAMAGGAEA